MRTKRAKPDLSRFQEAYREGKESFELGQPVDNCPYMEMTKGSKHWSRGWYDARTNKRLGHVFDRHNVTYP